MEHDQVKRVVVYPRVVEGSLRRTCDNNPAAIIEIAPGFTLGEILRGLTDGKAMAAHELPEEIAGSVETTLPDVHEFCQNREIERQEANYEAEKARLEERIESAKDALATQQNRIDDAEGADEPDAPAIHAMKADLPRLEADVTKAKEDLSVFLGEDTDGEGDEGDGPEFVTSQADLAKALDVSSSTVSNWAKQEGFPPKTDDGYNVADVRAWRDAQEKGNGE